MSNISSDSINDALQRAKQLAAVNSNGQKRALNDDLNFHPAKRSNASNNMAGMGFGGPMNGDTTVETVEIPDNAVGLVIGRGGEQITHIQQQTGCRVQMAGENSANGFRSCSLQGTRQSIEKAKKMVNDVIERSRNVTGGAGHPVGGHMNGSIITTELFIPGPKCGLIIGKNGETIKGLQEAIGVKMLLIQDSQQVSMGPKPLRITGSVDKVEHAKREVEKLLNSEDGNGTNQISRPGPKSIGEVIVPRSSVGIIIGKGGDMIKKLAQDSGAKIQFKPDDNPSAQDRCAVIQGTPDQINRATQLISELVAKSVQGSAATEVFYMHVPANKTGLVIGKGGDTIKQICAETGAHVELSRDPPPNPNEKVFVIKGTAYQIHHVQHIIRIKVGDIAPGTPVPPFHGAVGATPTGAMPGTVANNNYPTGHQFGGAPDQFAAAGPWGQHNAPVAQDSAWTHYYNQQQQAGLIPAGAAAQPNFVAPQAQHYPSIPAVGVQHQQQIPQQSQQQQVNAGQVHPTINPTTGQPDYSAQWAEYYRTMGMHDQANLIESQMKQQQQMPGGVQTQNRPQVYYNS